MKSCNKYDSLLVKKKFNNKHTYSYNCKPWGRAEGGFWTPPLGSHNAKKHYKRIKKRLIRKRNQEQIELGWMDYEIYREEIGNDIQQSDDDDIFTDWKCLLCGFQNTKQAQFCKECNCNKDSTQYNDDHDDRYYFQLHRIQYSKQKKKRKLKKRKNRKKKKIVDNNDFKHYWNSTKNDFKYQNKNKYSLGTKEQKELFEEDRNKNDNILNHAKYTTLKRQLLASLLYDIKYFFKYAICMDVECVLKDNWMNKININDIDKDWVKNNIVYTDRKVWKLLYPSNHTNNINYIDPSYNEDKIREMLKSDSILKQCDNSLLVCGYLRSNDNNIYIPNDIIVLCTLLCGVINELLPYNLTNYNVDIGQYYQLKDKKIKCYQNACDIAKLLQNNGTRWKAPFYSNFYFEIFICLIIDNNKTYKTFHRYDIQIIKSECNNVIPIFKITKKIGYKSLTWNGWLKYSRFHNKQFMIDKYIRNRYKKYFCPLTNEMMNNPVRSWSDNGIYEREAIKHYFKMYGTSPITGKKLRSYKGQLCVSRQDQLKQEISQFKARNINDQYTDRYFTYNIDGKFQRLNEKHNKTILKYSKIRNYNRYKQRKWSAYHKLCTE